MDKDEFIKKCEFWLTPNGSYMVSWDNHYMLYNVPWKEEKKDRHLVLCNMWSAWEQDKKNMVSIEKIPQYVLDECYDKINFNS